MLAGVPPMEPPWFCPTCLSVDATYVVEVRLDKAQRAIVEHALRKDGCGMALEIANQLAKSRCSSCGGDGYAPYVGGDDDESLCSACRGTGFDSV
jgi:DnaJ-class molecular chaperone